MKIRTPKVVPLKVPLNIHPNIALILPYPSKGGPKTQGCNLKGPRSKEESREPDTMVIVVAVEWPEEEEDKEEEAGVAPVPGTQSVPRCFNFRV